MEEEKKKRSFLHHFIWLFCVFLLIFSTGGLLKAGYAADSRGELDVMEYDQESGSLVPDESLAKDITLWFWLGAGAGVVLFAYALLGEVSARKKVFGGIAAFLVMLLNIQLNGILASFAFVDVGIGMMPQCQLSEEGGGQFLRASHKIEPVVGVYFILNGKGYRVDGYDPGESTRTYAAVQEMDILLNPWTIYVYEKGQDDPWSVLVYEENETYLYYKNLSKDADK